MARCFVCEREVGGGGIVQDDGRLLCVHCDKAEAYYAKPSAQSRADDDRSKSTEPVEKAASNTASVTLPSLALATGIASIFLNWIGIVPLFAAVLGCVAYLKSRNGRERKYSLAAVLLGVTFAVVGHSQWRQAEKQVSDRNRTISNAPPNLGDWKSDSIVSQNPQATVNQPGLQNAKVPNLGSGQESSRSETRKPPESRVPEPAPPDVRGDRNIPITPPKPKVESETELTFGDIEGGYLMAGSTYLGLISTNKYDGKSIANSYGDHGSQYADKSIFNKFSEYGSQVGNNSPYNRLADDPPKVYDKNGTFKAFLSVNPLKSPRLNPDLLLGWLKSRE